MVALKVQVEWLVMAYESLSNLDLGLGRAPLVWYGHLTSIALCTCGEVKLFRLGSCGYLWARAGFFRRGRLLVVLVVWLFHLFA
jgi:hypothetical protein